MSELVTCIDAVAQMMGKCIEAQFDQRGFHRQVIAKVTRWFEEGLDMKAVIALMLERQREKQQALVLGENNHDHLNLGDFAVIEKKIGLNEVNPENKKRWEEKFKSGRAKYLCPHCSYSGNSEFGEMAVFGSGFIRCGRPGCGFFAYRQYFSRDWTPEKQATYEQEQQARHASQAAAAATRAAVAERRRKLQAKVRAEAIAAVKQIGTFQWELNGNDPEEWTGIEQSIEEVMETEIKRIMQLMVFYHNSEGAPPVPGEDIVAFFKTHLEPTGDDELDSQAFERCAKAFWFDMTTTMEGGL